MKNEKPESIASSLYNEIVYTIYIQETGIPESIFEGKGIREDFMLNQTVYIIIL